MSHYGFNDESERENDFNADLPVPTYEEVVGAAANNIGFKENVLLAPPAYPAQRSLAGSSAVVENRTVAEENNEVYCEQRPFSKKKAIYAITLVIYFLLCGVFIYSVFKTECKSPPVRQNTDPSQITYRDYKECESQQWFLDKRLREQRGNDWLALVKEYDKVSAQKENVAMEIRDLKLQAESIKRQTAELQRLSTRILIKSITYQDK